MAIDFFFIVCPIEGCDGEVIWVVDDDEANKYWIACPACGKQYELRVDRAEE